MSGYAKIAEGLRMMAEGFGQLADAKTADTVPAAKAERAEKETPKAKASTKQEPKAEEAQAQKVDVKDVRAVMRQKIKDGKMEECQDILHSFGYEKLTDVPEEKLGELLAKVEVL